MMLSRYADRKGRAFQVVQWWAEASVLGQCFEVSQVSTIPELGEGSLPLSDAPCRYDGVCLVS